VNTREDYVAGLRAAADFIEQHPDLPVPAYALNLSGSLGSAFHDDGRTPEDRVAAAAQALGVPMAVETVGEDVHYSAGRTFVPVEARLTYVAFGADGAP